MDAYQTYKVGETWYIKRSDQQIWGQGQTLEMALENLKERTAEYDQFCQTVGLPTLDVQAAGLGVRAAALGTWRFLRIVIVLALCAIPVSYAISSGITRGIENADIKGGRVFWSKVEKGILEMGEEGKGLPPEKAAALQNAMENIVARIRPFSSQLSLLFVPPNDDQGNASAINGQ